MKKGGMMRWGFTLALCGCLLSQPARTEASDSQVERVSLTGLPALSVVVEELGPTAEKNGLMTASMQAEAERRLKQAGISLTPDADAYLYIHVTIADPGGALPLPYFIEVGLMQEITLPRGVKARTPFQSETWSLTRLGLVAPAGLRSAVVDRVNEFVEQFIAAYKAANAKPAI
jgi:hypothetical protein